eukprot:SAG31_NODE_2243_length_6102_cov_5.923205_2_plen_146_part_00
MAELRAKLPANAVLVGQNILKDVQWLGLRHGTDFAQLVDLAGLLRCWNPRHGSFSYFGLDHYATVWLGDGRADGQAHDAADDAVKSCKLFNAYRATRADPVALAKVEKRVIETPPAPSFAKLNPSWEGCCMGNKKTCTCGAPFFS